MLIVKPQFNKLNISVQSSIPKRPMIFQGVTATAGSPALVMSQA